MRVGRKAENSDEEHVRTLCARYTKEVCCFGNGPGEIDTLVLGCTHYPFAGEIFRALLGPDVRIVETGEPVARQTRRLLEERELLNPAGSGHVRWQTTGDERALRQAAARWLGV